MFGVLATTRRSIYCIGVRASTQPRRLGSVATRRKALSSAAICSISRTKREFFFLSALFSVCGRDRLDAVRACKSCRASWEMVGRRLQKNRRQEATRSKLTKLGLFATRRRCARAGSRCKHRPRRAAQGSRGRSLHASSALRRRSRHSTGGPAQPGRLQHGGGA